MPIRSPDVNEAARRPSGDTPALADFDPATGDPDDASRPTPAGWPRLPGFCAFLGGYVALVVFFKWADPYHRHFATSGGLTVAYNAARVAFTFYLFCMVHALGTLLLRLLTKERPRIGKSDQIALGFFAGTAPCHVGMLILGFLGLDTVPTALIVSLPLVALSYGNVVAVAKHQRLRLIAWQSSDKWTATGVFTLLAAILICLAAAMLFMVKGLYPGGGHDYFTHYFYFDQAVIDRGNIWPNNVWYHFFYSKGSGLFYLSMLLTDPLAPSLVTMAFIGASALALHGFLRRLAPGSLWAMAGTILFVALYIYTPGQHENRSNGGWGEFQKLHEIVAALVIALLWTAAGALAETGRAKWPWLLAAASAAVTAVIIDTTIAAYVGGIFLLLSGIYLVARDLRRAFICVGLGTVTAAALAAMLLINFLATGIPNDQGILWFWPIVDVEKIYRWGALASVILLHLGATGMAAQSVPLSRDAVSLLFESLRLDLLFPLAVLGVAAAIVHLVRRGGVRKRHDAAVLLAALVAFGALALTVGRGQPISFYRYSSFAMPLVILAAVGLAALPLRTRSRPLSFRWGWLVPSLTVVTCLAVAGGAYPADGFKAVTKNAMRFVSGQYSIDTAYVRQEGWPGRATFGGIYPAARAAYQIVGPHTRIWSMHIHSYCMLPDCQMESFVSMTMSPDWDRLMFGSPEEGRRVLQAAGLDYFFFSREMQLRDILPASPLFSPDNISRYLGIRWTDGTSALLTWAGPDTTPIDPDWIAEYRREIDESGTTASFPYAAMQQIFATLRATPHPWRSLKLPW